MSDRRSPSRPPQATPLRRVCVRVPAHYAEDLRRFAGELRTRQPAGPTPAREWRGVSPSADLLMDLNARRGASSGTPERAAQVAFIGAS
jgi:hypothetical protein